MCLDFFFLRARSSGRTYTADLQKQLILVRNEDPRLFQGKIRNRRPLSNITEETKSMVEVADMEIHPLSRRITPPRGVSGSRMAGALGAGERSERPVELVAPHTFVVPSLHESESVVSSASDTRSSAKEAKRAGIQRSITDALASRSLHCGLEEIRNHEVNDTLAERLRVRTSVGGNDHVGFGALAVKDILTSQ